MDRQFCISYIIINHMRHAFQVKNMSLPYENFITRIICLHHRNIPQQNRIACMNLFHELSNIEWVKDVLNDLPA
jgi:hypothetical protein